MKNLIAAIAALFMVGCATPADLLEGEPQLLVRSPRPADQVAACVADAWSKRHGTVIHLPTTTGYRVIIPHPNAGADAVAEITRETAGSMVRYAARMPSLMPAWVMEAVESCR